MQFETKQCIKCKNLTQDVKIFPGCKAFPVGIPEQILTGEHDHTKPFKGDNGIMFEPIEDEKEKE